MSTSDINKNINWDDLSQYSKAIITQITNFSEPIFLRIGQVVDFIKIEEPFTMSQEILDEVFTYQYSEERKGNYAAMKDNHRIALVHGKTPMDITVSGNYMFGSPISHLINKTGSEDNNVSGNTLVIDTGSKTCDYVVSPQIVGVDSGYALFKDCTKSTKEFVNFLSLTDPVHVFINHPNQTLANKWVATVQKGRAALKDKKYSRAYKLFAKAKKLHKELKPQ